jgi:hypothetical protein
MLMHMSSASNKKYSKPVISYLKNDRDSLCLLLKKAQTNQQIESKLKTKLDPSFSKHFTLANINNDVAVLHAHSSAWATRLRYIIPQLLNIFTNDLGLKTIKTVRIKLASPPPKPASSSMSRPILSKASSETITQTAHNIEDVELRAILLKISSYFRPD